MSAGFDLFEEREQPPMSAEMFTTLAAARLRSIGFEVAEQRRLALVLRVSDRNTVARLGRFYDRYRQAPVLLAPILGEVLSGVKSGETEPVETMTFQEAAPNLLPMLVGVAEWEEKRSAGISMVVRPVVKGLGLSLVLDHDEAFSFVGTENLPIWGIDLESAFGIAIENLERRSQGTSFSRAGEGTATLLIDRTQDGYAATRGIVPSRLRAWSHIVPGELVLGMPSRDLLLGFSSQHPQLSALASQVEQDSTRLEHGLFGELLRYRDGKLLLLCLDSHS